MTSFRIFLNYRREDASGETGRLYDFLRHGGEREGFAKEQIFRDIDTIAPGVDFRRAIDEAVGSCDVFIAVIGRRWLDVADAEGRRRLDKENDFVRLEIEAALAEEIPVVPALVQGAEMPSAEELPETLSDFAHRNAVELSDARWDYDAGRLTAWLKTVEQEEVAALEAMEAKREREATELAERKRQERESAKRQKAGAGALTELEKLASNTKLPASLRKQLPAVAEALETDEKVKQLGVVSDPEEAKRRGLLVITDLRLLVFGMATAGQNFSSYHYRYIDNVSMTGDTLSFRHMKEPVSLTLGSMLRAAQVSGDIEGYARSRRRGPSRPSR